MVTRQDHFYSWPRERIADRPQPGAQQPADSRPKRSAGSYDLEKKHKHVLKITHIATGFEVEFPAFLDALSDAYTSNWTPHEAFGRMDSMATFGSTKRNISIAWSVPADSYEHAQQNLEKVNALIQFLYPLYDNSRKDRDPVINMDPIWRLSFGNLIRNAKTGTGLLGYVNGVTFDPDLPSGMFKDKPYAKVGGQFRGRGSSEFARGADGRQRTRITTGNPQNNAYFPKTFRLNVEFRVLHEHSLGYAIGEHAIKEEGIESKRTTYAFNDPKLNFTNYPYQTPESNRARSWREDTVIKSRGRPSVINPLPDPVQAAHSLPATPPGSVATEEESQPKVHQLPAPKGVEKKHVFVKDHRGNIVGAERTD